MSDLNCFVFEGRLVKNAELGYFDQNSAYCKFAVANDESYKDQNGEYQNIPTFIDCVCKGKFAEAMCKHLVKGRALRVMGRIKQQRWTKDNVNYSKLIVKVQEIHLSPLNSQSETQTQNYNNNQEYQQKPAQEFVADDFDDDEPEFIPF